MKYNFLGYPLSNVSLFCDKSSHVMFGSEAERL